MRGGTDLESALEVVDRDLQSRTARLFELLAIPCISSEPEAKPFIDEAAEWLSKELEALGFSPRVHHTAGHPLVLAHSKGDLTEGAPVLLFYGHYDVQPIGTLADWKHPPFEPKIVQEDGRRRFYARGASDSKSQLWTFLEGLRAWKEVHGGYPARLIILLEGEEESGSHSLPTFLNAHRDELRCDIAFICDGDMWSATQPALSLRLKGLLHEKATLRAPNRDLHSGMFGAVAVNPIRVLASILAGLHDEHGRIAIPDFYDDVEDISAELRAQWQVLSGETDLFEKVDLRGGVMESGYTPIEAIWGRPTVDINGVTGGNQGPGERSVIAGEATARLSFRLVEGQEPENVRAMFRAYVRTRVPEGCSVEFEGFPGSSAVTMPEANPFVQAAARGLADEWGKPTILTGSGGSIPLAQLLKEVLEADCIVVGFILADDAIHGPDEHYDLERLQNGARSWVRVLAEIAAIAPCTS